MVVYIRDNAVRSLGWGTKSSHYPIKDGVNWTLPNMGLYLKVSKRVIAAPICPVVKQMMACLMIVAQIARLMGPTWGPSGADRTQVGPILAPWTLLSGSCYVTHQNQSGDVLATDRHKSIAWLATAIGIMADVGTIRFSLWSDDEKLCSTNSLFKRTTPLVWIPRI